MNFKENYQENKKDYKKKVLVVFLFVLFVLVGWLISSKTDDARNALADVYDNVFSFLSLGEGELFPAESQVNVSDINFEEITKKTDENQEPEEPVLISEEQEEQNAEEAEEESPDNALSPREKQINQMKSRISLLRSKIGDLQAETAQMQRKINILQKQIQEIK